MTIAVRAIIAVVAVGVICTSARKTVHAQSVSSPATQPLQDQAALEKQFERTMTGAVLVGRFTDTARPDDPPREERYTIQRVSKVDAGGDRWLFICRIQFGRKDVAIPLTIPVKWAGDTPVISVTDMTIPGLGTYTARVMIAGDHYAGTWRGDRHGGHLWGRIERASSTRPATTQATP
jgi:hypothetical protein